MNHKKYEDNVLNLIQNVGIIFIAHRKTHFFVDLLQNLIISNIPKLNELFESNLLGGKFYKMMLSLVMIKYTLILGAGVQECLVLPPELY